MTNPPPPPYQGSPPGYPSQPASSPYPYAAGAPGPRTNTLAIISLVLAFFVPVGGVITGHIALSQISRTRENGGGLAIAGLVIGYLSTFIGFVVIMSVLAS
jgi:hypothetical protein